MADAAKTTGSRSGRRLAPVVAELRRQAVATAIEQAALRLFASRGSAEVTVEEIAAAAGVGERTLYRYFPTKDDILMAYPRRSATAFAERLRERASDETPYEALVNTVRAAPSEEARLDFQLWTNALLDSASSARTARLSLEFLSRAVTQVLAERTSRPADDLWAAMGGAITAAAMEIGAYQWAAKGGTIEDHQLAALELARPTLDRV